MATDFSAFDGTVTKSKIIESLIDTMAASMIADTGRAEGLLQAVRIVMSMPSIEETHQEFEDEDQGVIDRLVDAGEVNGTGVDNE